MTTNETRNVFLFFTSKNNTGYISPEEFDRAINRAQYELYGDYIGMPETARGDGIPQPIAYDQTRRVAETLLPFKTERGILLTNGRGTFATDYVYTDAFRSRYYKNPTECDGDNGEPVGVHTWTPIDIVTEKEWGDRTISKIDYPTTRYPVVRFANKTTIEVLPTTIRLVQHIYLRQPADFHWAYTIVNDEPVWNPADPTDQPLEWFELDQNKVVMRALSYFGIAIKDAQLTQYAEMKENTGV